MTAVFPQAPLGTGVDLYLGSWTSITTPTCYVYQRAPISITRGRPDQASLINPSQATMTLNNRDGRFTINNPVGPYYGTLRRNAPVRISVPTFTVGLATYLRMEDDQTSFASCPAASGIELTGSIDVRVDVQLSGYGEVTFASVWSASASVDQRCWKLGLLPTGQLSMNWTTGGTVGTAFGATSSAQVPLPMGRLVVRATLDATTGNVTFYTGPAGGIDGSTWTQLGAVAAGSGAFTLFHSTTAPLVVGYSAGLAYDNGLITGMNGAVYDMELRSGIGGTVVAHPSFATQTAGATSWTDAQSNAWTVTGTAELSARLYRFHGELTSVPKASDPTARDIYSQVVVSGVLRRLQQGQNPLASALYRGYVRLTGGAAPVAYWPCEDGQNATSIASGLTGGTPMPVVGSPAFASNADFACSGALPSLNGSTWTGSPPAGLTWAANGISFLFEIPSGGEADGTVMASVYTSGVVSRADLVYNTANGGELTLNLYSSTSALSATTGPVQFTNAAGNVGINGLPGFVNIDLTTSGGFVFGGLLATPANLSLGSGVAGSLPVTGSIGAVTSVVINPVAGLTGTAIGHIAIGSTITFAQTAIPNDNLLTAYIGELAAVRYQRLCAEEGIPVRIYGHPSLSAPMGYQTIETLPQLLQECETTDRGMQYEPRTCLGLGYRTLTSMYNQAPAATAVYSSAQLDRTFSSTSDDQLTLNDVTVTNQDASSARLYLASGPMSTLAPPNGIGRVDTSTEVNAASDGQLQSIAGWILHVSTTQGDRVPVIPFNLARSETPLGVALLDIGDFIAITHPPTWVQYDEIDQLCAGFTEAFGPFGVWQININGIPEQPYEILQISGGTGRAFRLDTDGSTLTTGVNSTATSISVTTLAGFPIWTTSAGDFPFDIGMSGERMTVTNITGSTSPQTFTVTRSVNGVVKSQLAGAAISLWYPAILGL